MRSTYLVFVQFPHHPAKVLYGLIEIIIDHNGVKITGRESVFDFGRRIAHSAGQTGLTFTAASP